MERWLVEAVKIVTPKRVGGMMKKYSEILTYYPLNRIRTTIHGVRVKVNYIPAKAGSFVVGYKPT